MEDIKNRRDTPWHVSTIKTIVLLLVYSPLRNKRCLSIVILEEVIIIEIQRVEHQIPVLAPNEIAVLQLIVEKTHRVVVAIILRVRTLDEIRLKIYDIALAIRKGDTKFVIATRFNLYNIVWVHHSDYYLQKYNIFPNTAKISFRLAAKNHIKK